MGFNGELHAICKAYGEVQANRGVDLVVRSGTIHALVGENGAGKSTAMKILFGIVKPDSGTIRFGKSDVTHWNPQQAFKHGIGMVHQHFMLAGNESVLDNLTLGTETTRFGLRDRKTERAQLEELMKITGLKVPLNMRTDLLPIGLQSRCEILKVLYRKARFLILDEPTAVLTPQETADFLTTLRVLRERGNTILIVTHKLKEVMAVADEATVLRAGQTVAVRKTSETSAEELSELMVGRRLQMPRVSKLSVTKLESRLEIKEPKFEVSLRRGEITGIAGVEGSGQDDLIHAITKDFKKLRSKPIAFIPADRHKEGLVLSFNLSENLRLGREQLRTSGLRYFNNATEAEHKLLQAYDVRPSDPTLSAKMLSGGNQQKVIIARELGELDPKELAESIVLAVHPTRGVDLGAIEFIHGKLLDAAAKGAAVLLVSSELDELMALSHRIGVFYHGSIAQWFEGPPYDEKAIGLAMLTGRTSEAKQA